MKKYLVCVDTYACASYEVEANSPEEAKEKVHGIISNDDDFWSNYREQCEIFEPTVTYADEA